MKNRTLATAILAPLTLSIVLFSHSLHAQSTNKAPANKPAPEKKAVAHPFHGTLTAVDKNAKTITVGKVTYRITSETKLKKNDKPATLDDGVIGDEVAGYVKPDADGKLFASSVRFGAKSDSKGTKKK
jgi:hypothetical protein